MATQFKNRVFGGAIERGTQEKLKTKQRIHSSEVGPGDLRAQEILNLENITSGYEASGRTTFARMWTAIESVPLMSDQRREKLKQLALNSDGSHNLSLLERLINEEEQKLKREQNIQPKVYMVGDYKGNAIPKVSNETVYYNLSEQNEFDKQTAGITSINTATEGSVGALLTTIISFKVNNFHDFENVFTKYFLRPGAVVVIDFGWDTEVIYDPATVIKQNPQIKNIIGEESIVDVLYKDGGVVEISNGNMFVLGGRVMDYDAKVQGDGTFDCSLTIVSPNRGLLDQNLETENLARQKLVERFDTIIFSTIINYYATAIGEKPVIKLNQVLSASPEGEKNFRQEALKVFAQEYNKLYLGDTAILSGLFIPVQAATSTGAAPTSRPDFNIVGIGDVQPDDLPVIDESDIITGTIDDEGNFTADPNGADQVFANENNILININTGLPVGIDPPPPTTPAQDDIEYVEQNGDIYASWGWIEDNVLNREFTIAVASKSGDVVTHTIGAGNFNSTESFIYYDELVHTYSKALMREDKSPIMLFPDDDYNFSYNTVKGRTPSVHRGLGSFNRTKYDKLRRQIPLREVFFQVNAIKSVFESQKFRVVEAISSLLDDINLQFPNYELDYFADSKDFTGIALIDKSMTQLTNDKFEDTEFEFTPFSESSIVYDIDLSYATPKGGLQSMIAIAAQSPNIPLTSGDLSDRQQAQLRRLTLDAREPNFYFKHLSQPPDQDPFVGGGSASALETFDQDRLTSTYKKLGFASISQPGLIKQKLDSVAKNLATAPVKQHTDLNDAKGSKKDDKSNVVDTESEMLKKLLTREQSLQSPVLPFNLTLSIYGTGGIYPGDLITVDYLPAAFKKRATFFVTKISHDISSTWKTTLETVMKLKPVAKDVPPKAKREIVPPIKPVERKPPEIIKDPVGREPDIKEKPTTPPPPAAKASPAPLSNNKIFGGGKVKRLRVSENSNFGRVDIVRHRHGDFAIAPDLFLTQIPGQYFRWPALESAFVKTLNQGKIPKNYPSPVFSANRLVRPIYEAYGYTLINAKELIPIGEFSHQLSNNEQQSFNAFYNSLQVLVLPIRNPLDYIVLTAGIGSNYPQTTFLAAEGKRVPEDYYGFGDLPQPEDWITEVYGEWKSDQNGHIVENSNLTFDDLRNMDDNQRRLEWRKTPRGSLNNSLEQDMNTIADHYQKWLQAWYGPKMQKTFAENKFKLTYRPTKSSYASAE